jgi:probable rRNA maturation factor
MPRRRAKPKVVVSSSQRAVRVPRKKLVELVTFVAGEEGVRIEQIDLAVVDRKESASLNRRYLHHSGPTDVLSFDLSESPTEGICAQLVVCGEMAAARAAPGGCSAQHELMLYVVHGLLHLTGYEDTTVRGAARMDARQDELLEAFRKKRR